MSFLLSEFDAADGLRPAPGKSCGGCTACCQTLAVREINLRSFQRCPHLCLPFEVQAGCRIYTGRPRSCSEWCCTWLISDMPDELRPDRCGVVLNPLPQTIRIDGEDTAAAEMYALPGYEEAWARDPVKSAIAEICRNGLAVLYRMSPDKEGRLMARGFRWDKKAGNLAYSHEAFQTADQDDPNSQRRAQELLRRIG